MCSMTLTPPVWRSFEKAGQEKTLVAKRTSNVLEMLFMDFSETWKTNFISHPVSFSFFVGR